MNGAQAALSGSADQKPSNPARGEATLVIAGRPHVLRPTFNALVCAEEELGPLFALVERAGEGQLRLAEIAMLRAEESDVDIIGILDPHTERRRFAGLPVWVVMNLWWKRPLTVWQSDIYKSQTSLLKQALWITVLRSKES